MSPARQCRLAVLIAAVLIAAIAGAQDAGMKAGMDPDEVALTYHHVTGEPLDLPRAAERSEVVRHANGFDKPDATKAEIDRLQKTMDAAAADHEFTVRINDSISQYDHDRGAFTVTLFSPGYFVPIDAFGQQYRLVFENAEAARAIAMPKEQARAFDQHLNTISRGVENELHFRVIGKGDPAGAVTGERVIRARLTAVKIFDHQNNLVYEPKLDATAATAARQPVTVFDAASADVAGLRVGISADDLTRTLTRLFGTPVRGAVGKDDDARYTGVIELNGMGCLAMPGRTAPKPGAVCVTAWLDKGDTVRAVRIQRLFAWFDEEVYRKTLVARYGAVASAQNGSDFALGWGPEVDKTLAHASSPPFNAVSAHYAGEDTSFSRGNNALPMIKVTLQLVDADWAAKTAR